MPQDQQGRSRANRVISGILLVLILAGVVWAVVSKAIQGI
jgi:hypothetical protein